MTDDGDSDTYTLGGLLSLSLVVGVLSVAERPARRVEDHGEFIGLFLPQQVLQHQHEAKDSTGVSSLAINTRGLDEGIVCPID